MNVCAPPSSGRRVLVMRWWVNHAAMRYLVGIQQRLELLIQLGLLGVIAEGPPAHSLCVRMATPTAKWLTGTTDLYKGALCNRLVPLTTSSRIGR